jgi:hypothetical protein
MSDESQNERGKLRHPHEPDFQAHKLRHPHANDEPQGEDDSDFEAHKLRHPH